MSFGVKQIVKAAFGPMVVLAASGFRVAFSPAAAPTPIPYVEVNVDNKDMAFEDRLVRLQQNFNPQECLEESDVRGQKVMHIKSKERLPDGHFLTPYAGRQVSHFVVDKEFAGAQDDYAVPVAEFSFDNLQRDPFPRALREHACFISLQRFEPGAFRATISRPISDNLELYTTHSIPDADDRSGEGPMPLDQVVERLTAIHEEIKFGQLVVKVAPLLASHATPSGKEVTSSLEEHKVIAFWSDRRFEFYVDGKWKRTMVGDASLSSVEDFFKVSLQIISLNSHIRFGGSVGLQLTSRPLKSKYPLLDLARSFVRGGGGKQKKGDSNSR